MVNKQDSYWTECSLDEIVDRKVCEYLRGHHAEYRNAKKRIKELMDQYPNVQAVFETEDAVTLTAEEHEILHTYFQLESSAKLIERRVPLPTSFFFFRLYRINIGIVVN